MTHILTKKYFGGSVNVQKEEVVNFTILSVFDENMNRF